MDSEQLLQRDIAILEKARSLGSNPDAIFLFFVVGVAALVGMICVLAMGVWGVAMLAAIASAVVADRFLKFGDRFLVIGVALLSLLVGLGSLAVAIFVWTGKGG
ncbi:MAG: hypothetical protein NZM37_12810 [Sandaracinaceae bacterium]|nr:hypothetical protein [Sandaracinaceae bacterium]